MTKVLNPVGMSCIISPMEQDVLSSHPVLILGIRNVPRHADQDAGTIAE